MFSLSAFTTFHTVLSLIALGAGIIVVLGMCFSQMMPKWTMFYLVTSLGTDLTGFAFPFIKFLPSHATGIVSLLLLAFAIYARYARGMAGSFRWSYVASMVASVYLIAFVGIVQTFLKIPSFKTLAPTGSETPFVIAHAAVLLVFIVLGVIAVKKFLPLPERNRISIMKTFRS